MRVCLAAALVLASISQLAAEEIVSEYTRLDTQRDCAVFAMAEDGEGEWSNLVCSGYRGYPVVIYYGDARESVFYGFPPAGDLAPAWESFSAFNHVGPTIEWRIARDGDRVLPFATIHRWFVDLNEAGQGTVEVLVVEKVGQIHAREGCAVGYVVASGNPGANEKARRIADTQARDFACGDQPAIDTGSVALPDFTRFEN